MKDLTDLLQVFTYKQLRETETILNLLIKNSITIEEFQNYISDYTFKKYTEGTEVATKRKEKYKKEKNIILKYAHKCPICNSVLYLREDIKTDFESVLYCTKCNYEYYTDISVEDQKMLFNARVKGTKVDFPVDEIRATIEKRKERRKICIKCKYLTSWNICKACGCRMKHRTYYEILTCPKKFW